MNEREERVWDVVRRAFEERAPAPAPQRNRFAAVVVLAVVAALAASFLSPPGHALFKRFREAVGVAHADPALFDLPARGRILVVSQAGGGVWLVHDNGLKRRIGSYTDAEWSPHGEYVVVTRPNELAAIDPDGPTHWSLARRGARWPRWEGTRTDSRIAYWAASGLRVVAGDGRDDRLVDPHALRLPAAWSPRRLHTLAYVSGGSVVLRDVDARRTLWRAPLGRGVPFELAWSSDGRYVAVASAHAVQLLSGDGRVVRRISTGPSDTVLAAAFRPGTHELALSTRSEGLSRRSAIRLVGAERPSTVRQLFAGPGAFGDIAWSPDGRWLLLDWRTANQWLFVGPGAPPRVHAVANIRGEFPRRDDVSPTLSFQGRWCCG